MNRLVALSVVTLGVGTTLLLSQWSRLSRPTLSQRLKPFAPGGSGRSSAVARGGSGSFGRVLTPLLRDVGDRASKVMGVIEPLDLRLRRLHSDLDPAAFRFRQAAWAVFAMLAAAVLSWAARLPALPALLFVAGGGFLGFLVIEQKLVKATDKWRRDLSFELPVVAEQLAMLLNAGFSLGSAMGRIAARGSGVVSADLEIAVNRVRQGLSEADALKEWSERAGFDGVTRLVSILTVHSHSTDLGTLVSAEARSSRRELQRRSIEMIERRSQQVWVPVTVATLIPGVILLAVPFLSALNAFSNT